MKLIWLDIETTGLNPETDAILEVAAFEATLDRPFDAVKIYDTVLEFHRPADDMFHPIVREMHTKNGLWEACDVSCVGARSAESDLLRRIPPAVDDREPHVLAGSSVHLDHSFISHHMPKLNARFSHRHYDVSAVSLFARSLGMPKLPKTEAHRAAQDVLNSIAQAKTISEWFRARPPV